MSTIRLLLGVAMVAILTGCAGMKPAADNRPDTGTPDKPSAFPTNPTGSGFLLLD
jgi:hypothetical protein